MLSWVSVKMLIQTPIQIPVNANPERVIIAHRLLESRIHEGEPIGKLIANYVFYYANGHFDESANS